MLDIDCKAYELMLSHSPQCYLIAKADGNIYWANESFLRWSKYTLGELKHLGWKKIGVEDENLDTDFEDMKKFVDGEHTCYMARKKYIPKNEKPEWGDLIATRYPEKGDVEFFICQWTPLKNGTAAAFALTIETIREFQVELNQMNTHINTISDKENQPASKKALVAIYDWSTENPRTALFVFIFFLTLIGVNNIAGIIEKVSIISGASG